jgi:ribosomal protein S18 acetylase RimI-like enzyme
LHAGDQFATTTVRQASIADHRQFYRQQGDLGLARQFLSERMQRNESLILLAVMQNGFAAGFAQRYPSFSSAAARRLLILNDLFVTPKFRRTGIGTALLSAAAAEGRKIGEIRLRLSTEATNYSAQALYERHGWRRELDLYTYILNLDCERRHS